MKNRNPRVVVIGGGVIGASVTYHLSLAGVPVVLVEKRGMTSGTSGACSGKVWLGTKKPGIHLKLAQASLELFEDLIQKYGEVVECEIGGEMLLIEKEEEIEFMQEFVSDQRHSGVDIRLLTKSETHKMQPESSGGKIAGSTYSPKGFALSAISLVYAFTEAAKSNGAEILRNDRVEAIRITAGRIQSVLTSRGEIRTDCVVNAAGVNAPEVGRMVGIEIPIVPLKGEIIITEAVPPVVRVPVTEAGYITVKRKPELVRQMSRAGVTCGIAQSIRGNVYIGASKQFVDFDNSSSTDGMVTLAQRAIHFFPVLARTQMIRAYAGLRPYTADGLPILGPVPEVEGFIMSTGHGGDGVALSMITGKLIAEFISKGETSINIEALALSRFATKNKKSSS